MHIFKSFDRVGKILFRKFPRIPVFTIPDNMGYYHLLEVGVREERREGGKKEGRRGGHKCICVFQRSQSLCHLKLEML